MSTMRGRIGLQAMGSENKLWSSKGEPSPVSVSVSVPEGLLYDNDGGAHRTF